MNLTKAIEILTDILHYVKPGDPPEEHQAIKIGISAIKRIQLARSFNDKHTLPRLPGED